MAQGKLKVKTKLPSNTKVKKVQNKGNAVTKRANCPIKPKKLKNIEANKLIQMISKAVNKTAEDEIRAISSTSKQQKLSKAQLVVANHHNKIVPAPSAK